MALLESKAEWQGGMEFAVQTGNHTVTIDAPERFGGQDNGPKPTYMLLAGLMGCTGMDVASILKKMRVPLEKFTMDSCADVADDDPHVFKKIELNYYFDGAEDFRRYEEQVKKAIQLSRETYCCVSIMFSHFCQIKLRAYINGEEIQL